eukprot:jgi/Mesvir1/4721/Mv11590-RA.1
MPLPRFCVQVRQATTVAQSQKGSSPNRVPPPPPPPPPLSDVGAARKQGGSKAKAPALTAVEHLEEVMLDSCSQKTGEAAIRCWEAYESFELEKQEASADCELGGSRGCQELYSLEAFASQVKGTDALIIMERVNGVAEAYRSRFKNLEQAFRATDLNKSGDISLDELAAMVLKFNIPGLSDKASVASLFLRCDANGDGRIDVHEFEKYLWKPTSPFEGGLRIDPLLRQAVLHGRDDIPLFLQ